MKFLIPASCPACSEQFSVEVNGSKLPPNVQCPKCDTRTYAIWPLGNVVAMLLMERARQELQEDEATLAVLLSAMAVEAEMSWLYFHWKRVDRMQQGIFGTMVDESWEKEWGEMRSMSKRLDTLSCFLTGMDFDKFAMRNRTLLNSVLSNFDPSTSFKKHFQDEFFEKRNRIVHYGEVDTTKNGGEMCVSLATALLSLMQKMHVERITTLDKTLTGQGVVPSTK